MDIFQRTIAISDLPDSTARGIEVAQITIIDDKGRRGHVWLEVKSDGKGGCIAKMSHAAKSADVSRELTVRTWIDRS